LRQRVKLDGSFSGCVCWNVSPVKTCQQRFTTTLPHDFFVGQVEGIESRDGARLTGCSLRRFVEVQ